MDLGGSSPFSVETRGSDFAKLERILEVFPTFGVGTKATTRAHFLSAPSLWILSRAAMNALTGPAFELVDRMGHWGAFKHVSLLTCQPITHVVGMGSIGGALSESAE